MGLKMEQLHVVISGLVQGVGFRYGARRTALSLGLTGWVRNRLSGEVELVAQGAAEKIETLWQWLQTGPPGARVDKIERLACDPAPESYSTFEIRPNSPQK